MVPRGAVDIAESTWMQPRLRGRTPIQSGSNGRHLSAGRYGKSLEKEG